MNKNSKSIPTFVDTKHAIVVPGTLVNRTQGVTQKIPKGVINTKSHVVCNTILFQVPGTRSGYKYLVRARCDMCTCDTPKFWSRSSVADPLTLPSFQSHPFQYLNSRSYKYRTFRPRDDRTLYQFRSFLISDASSVMLPTLIPCR